MTASSDIPRSRPTGAPSADEAPLPLVSVVMVCMDNPAMLAKSLPSIRQHTSVPCEVLVVAYLFSPENLALVRQTYPWVRFIESAEIRGFSENNNLALRQARGKYCFVVNDDTCWDGPLIDGLVACFDRLPPSAAVVSPTILLPDGSVQACGKPPCSLLAHFLHGLCLDRLYRGGARYTNGKGLFQSYNISGAAFMIKTDVFREMGWFDERYFFCPEDVALSTQLNRQGYRCYVCEPLRITHFYGGTNKSSRVILGTLPAFMRGTVLFYRKFWPRRVPLLVVLLGFNEMWRGLAWLAKWALTRDAHARVMAQAHRNALTALASGKTPKELFVRYYKGNSDGTAPRPHPDSPGPAPSRPTSA